MKKLFYKIFKFYRIVDEQFVTYEVADVLMRQDSEWKISPKEDSNRIMGMIWICKKERITQ